MSIQYSGGTYVNTTFATSAKTDILSNLQTSLVAAGWTVVSGAGTTSLLLQTAKATDSGNQGRVRLLDNGGAGIQVILENVSGSVKQPQSTANGGTLVPGVTYRLLATPFQFFCFPASGTAASRQFVCAGILYIPPFLQGSITEAFYLASNSLNDGDTSNPPPASFRASLSPLASMVSGTPGNHCIVVNGNLYEHSNNGFTFAADLATIVPANSFATNYGGSSFIPAYRWHDLSLQISEVLVACGTSAHNDEALIRGQLYDVCYISDVFAQNATTSFADSGGTHNFFCLSSSLGNNSLTRGSLFVATS